MKANHKQQLTAAGVTDAAHHDAVDRAVAAGVPFPQILDWVRRYGPGVLAIVETLVNTFGPAAP